MAKLSRLWAVALVAAFVTGPALAEEETPTVREEVERVREKAKDIAKRNQREALRNAEEERRAIEERAKLLYERATAQRDMERRREIRRGLAQGVKALRTLRGHEALADRMEAVLKRVTSQLETDGRNLSRWRGIHPSNPWLEKKKQRARVKEQAESVRALAWRVGTLRTAMKALLEANKRDAAEMMERAIHSGELMLEGRTDEEAQEVFRNTPNLGQLAELLGVSSKLWAKWGNKQHAASTATLSEYYQDRWEAHKAERRAASEDVEESEDEEMEAAEAEEHRRREQHEQAAKETPRSPNSPDARAHSPSRTADGRHAETHERYDTQVAVDHP